ncbi:Core trichothecene cluster (CTC) protein 15 [Colletotrichum orbiculare MAFF 240422]|uniref:Core trichothecene cluster (CTC) protein 15 n=1 Tax=Colletotrichum orbiculare (strain 104-T / ATCC 96160 / CBS 514.97 / LARS 414 / MAFF 240422) TaxID=1213857 RepID=N4V892_COLOR|nr:Core trichothecene cluster (CTC) protein 15 [Colletotrichum orbiculare MAFF 240422]
MELSPTSQFKLTPTSCNTCNVHFDSKDTRRLHSKSLWHTANLKRRLADLPPLTAEQRAECATPGGPTTLSSSDDSSSASDAEFESDPEDEFVPETCLFCNAASESFDANVVHMQKAHGLFIPDRQRLIVDLETLVKYLHLVIHGYRECLQCGTQRRTAEAVKQHMLGKSHCRFDITAPDSEYRDFYESAAGDEETSDRTRRAFADAVEERGEMRLSSGKLLTHRSTHISRPRPKRAVNGSAGDNLLQDGPVDESAACFQLIAPAGRNHHATKALTRTEKREVVFETQVSRLSVKDRDAIAHLPAFEQRSLVLARQKQLDKAERSERRLRTRLELKENKTAGTHFVNGDRDSRAAKVTGS